MTAPNLEFAIPTKGFEGSENTVRLFQAPSENHYKNNRKATPEQLQEAFDNGLPDLEEGSYSKMINYVNTEDWLRPSLLDSEKELGKEVVLIMEEKIHAKKPEGIRWLKVVIYDGIEHCYLLRSITNTYYNNISARNPNWNKQSKDENWWICLSTIGADIEFFNKLREVLDY